MDVIGQLTTPSSEAQLREAVTNARDAELNDEPMQNGKKRGIDVAKNTHFEFEFGGETNPEVFVYIERYDAEPGIEVMLWADYAWFDGESGDYDVSPSDGDKPLGTFADEVLRVVTDELDADHTPSFEFYQNARPSVVFTAVFYL